MNAHKVTIAAVKITLPADSTGLRTLRGVGYRAVCSCSWRSSVRRSWLTARAELLNHRAETGTEAAAS